jgi:hypothetical protein
MRRPHGQQLPLPDKAFAKGAKSAKGKGMRVLIECCDPCLAWAAADELREAGYEVATCWALGGGGPPRCPMVNGGTCRLVEEADVIVRSFAGRELQHRAIVEAVSRAAPGTPVCVEAPDGRGWVRLGGAEASMNVGDSVADLIE